MARARHLGFRRYVVVAALLLGTEAASEQRQRTTRSPLGMGDRNTSRGDLEPRRDIDVPRWADFH